MYLLDNTIGISHYSHIRRRKTRTFIVRHQGNARAMDHFHHNHGGMDMGDGGGDSPMCSMNVRSQPNCLTIIHNTSPPAPMPSSHLAHFRKRSTILNESYSLNPPSTDALHMGHQQPLHRLQPMARNRDLLPRHLHPGRDGADGGLRGYPGNIEKLRSETGRED